MTALVVPVFLLFFALRLAVEAGLDAVQLRHVDRTGGRVPPRLAGALDEPAAQRSRLYALARGRLGLLHLAYDALLTLVALLSGALPWLDATLARGGLQGAHRSVAFLLALALAGAAAELPFSLYGTFRLEARFGFNRVTPRLWCADRLKGLLLSLALGVPLLYAAAALFRAAGGGWWLWLFGLLAVVQLALAWAFPVLIAPLFNRFEPLPDGPLRDRLTALADAARFRTRGLFVVDASKRSGHSNAYFAGLVRPRIVLFDTLVRELTEDEAAAVLAHEIGHYRRRHVQRRLALGLATQLALLYVLALLVRWPPLFQAFGFDGPSFHGAVALASLCGGAFTFWLAPLEAWYSRRHEYEADRWAVELARSPGALASALVKLQGQNLSAPEPHPWYVIWHASHPPLLARLAAIEGGAAAHHGGGRSH